MGIKKTKFRIIPNDNDGNFNVKIPLKTDSVYYNNNSFKVKLTDSEKTLEETININEDPNTELNYSVSSSSTQTTEGETAIDLTVDVDNMVGTPASTIRTISLSTDGTDDVTLISPLNITSSSETFSGVISATDDNLVEGDELYNVTLEDQYGSFDLNNQGSYVSDSVVLPINVLDDDATYTLSVQDNATAIDENAGEVTFNISSNVLDGREVQFSITESASGSLSADNIDSVTGTNVTWNSSNKTGTFIPLATDGSASITVTLETDDVYYNNNSFNFTITESGSQFSEDGNIYYPNSISKSININEDPNTELNYSVSSSSTQTTEGETAIDLTVDVDNMVGSSDSTIRTISLSTNGADDVTIPASLNITSPFETFSGVISATDDNLVEGDESYTVTLEDQYGSFDLNNQGSYESDSAVLSINVLSDDSIPQYTLSVQGNVTAINENAGEVTFDISSNIRKTVDPVSFSITENSSNGLFADNIDSVTSIMFSDDFSSDISGWTTVIETSANWPYSRSNVIYSTSYDGTMRFASGYRMWAYAETPITHTNSGNQTNRIRINIPHISTNNSRIYVYIYKDDTLILNTGWQNLLETISSDYGVITAKEGGGYSGYLELEYTDDVDLSLPYKIRIGHEQINPVWDSSVWSYIYIGDVTVKEPHQSWDPSTNTGTFIPSAEDGSASVTVKLKTDDVYYNNNNFNFTITESGSEFSEDGNNYYPNSISKSIDINEDPNTELQYSVSTSSQQITEGGTDITVTVDVDNVVGTSIPSRTVSLSTNGADDVILPTPSELDIIGLTQDFVISATDDNLVEGDELYNVTLTESLGLFDLNNAALPSSGSLNISITILDDDNPEYTLSVQGNVTAINENAGEVTFDISSNVRDGREVQFSITENSSNGLSADNIHSVSGTSVDSWDPLTNTGTFIPSSENGSASITVTLETDDVYYNNNSFNFTITESGSQFSEDGNNYSPNSISKSIDIVEDPNTELQYSVSTSSLQTTEGGTDITVTVDVDNVVGGVPSRTVSLSTNGADDVTLPTPSELDIIGLTQDFVISATDDNLVEGDELYNVTLEDQYGSFDLNNSGSLSSDILNIPITILSDDSIPQYTLSVQDNVSAIDENAGEVTFDISSNARDGREVQFSITESASGSLSADNIDSVTGTNVTWNSSNKTGTFIPSSENGSASITVTLETDDVYYNNNSFNFTITESGSQFSEDGNNYYPNSISKSIDINEDPNTELNYSVSTSSQQTTEGGTDITVTVDVDNVVGTSVPGKLFSDNFVSDISGWTTGVEYSPYANVTHSTLDDGGTMRFGSYKSRSSYAETPITHTNSGTQTNRIRINIPNISSDNSQMYVQIYKDNNNTLVYNTGWQYLRETISSDFGVITPNGDGTYSGYLEVEYTDDVDQNLEYKIRIGHDQISYESAWVYTYVGDVTVKNPVNTRTISLSTNGTDDVILPTPSELDIIGLTQDFVISATDDNLVEGDELYNVTLEDQYGSFDLNNAALPSSDTLNIPITILDDDNPQYTLSVQGNETAINENAGEVTFDISSNVLDGREVQFSITESASGSLSADNIHSVTGTSVDSWDPSTNTGTFIPSSENGSASITVTLETDDVYYNGNSFNFTITESGSQFSEDGNNYYPNSISKSIDINEDPNTELNYSVSSSSTQTTEGETAIDLTVDVDNVVGTSVPSRTISLSTNGADDVTIPASLNITSSSETFSGVISATDDNLVEGDELYNVTLEDQYGSFDLNNQGSYESDSAVLSITILDDDNPQYTLSVQGNVTAINENAGEVTFDISSNIRKTVDPLSFSITESASGSLSADNIHSVTGTSVDSWDPLTNTGTFTPSAADGSASITVTLETDDVYYNNNSFNFTITESGSQFSEDGINYYPNSISKSININEDPNTELQYSVSTSSQQTTEGTTIDLTVDVDNVVGTSIPSRFIFLSTNGADDVAIPSTLHITSSSETFSEYILAKDDNLVEGDELYNVTLEDQYGSFDLNNAGSPSSDTLNIPITILDGTISQYTLSVQDNVTAINENAGEVTFDISSNIRKTVDPLSFSITESASGSLSADNIDSVTGTNVTWNSSNKTGTFIPLATDGSASITVTLETDDVYYNNNSFNFTITESGSEFSEDGINYYPNSISKSIDINEDPNTELNYSVSTSSQQITEGGTDITVTVDVDNMVGSSDSTIRTVSLSTNGAGDVILPTPSELDITGLTQDFVISANDNNLVDDGESYNVTLEDQYGSFDLNNAGSPSSDTLNIPITILDDSDISCSIASYSILNSGTNATSVFEGGGSVTFTISSNVRKSVDPVSFSIQESSDVATGLSADNIHSVTGTSVDSWDPLTNTGTFTPSAADGSASITVTLKEDEVQYIDNTFTFSVPGDSEIIPIRERNILWNLSATLSPPTPLTVSEGQTISFTVNVHNLVGTVPSSYHPIKRHIAYIEVYKESSLPDPFMGEFIEPYWNREDRIQYGNNIDSPHAQQFEFSELRDPWYSNFYLDSPTQTFTIEVSEDDLAEVNENYIIRIFNSRSYSNYPADVWYDESSGTFPDPEYQNGNDESGFELYPISKDLGPITVTDGYILSSSSNLVNENGGIVTFDITSKSTLPNDPVSFSIIENSSNGLSADNIYSVTGTDITWNPSNNTGTFIPAPKDSYVSITVTLTTDDVYYNNNSFIFSIPGNSKSIDIVEDPNTELQYSVSTSSLQTTEGGTDITVTVDVDNAIGGAPSRTISLSTNGADDVTLPTPSELDITGLTQNFVISATDDFLVEGEELYSVTLTESLGSFDLNNAESPSSGSLNIPVTILSDDVPFNFTIQSVESFYDDGSSRQTIQDPQNDYIITGEDGSVIITAYINRKNVPINFTITENSANGLLANNIDSVSGLDGTIVTWDSDSNTGTFISNPTTYLAKILISMKTDEIVWDDNYFNFQSEYSEDSQLYQVSQDIHVEEYYYEANTTESQPHTQIQEIEVAFDGLHMFPDNFFSEHARNIGVDGGHYASNQVRRYDFGIPYAKFAYGSNSVANGWYSTGIDGELRGPLVSHYRGGIEHRVGLFTTQKEPDVNYADDPKIKIYVKPLINGTSDLTTPSQWDAMEGKLGPNVPENFNLTIDTETWVDGVKQNSDFSYNSGNQQFINNSYTMNVDYDSNNYDNSSNNWNFSVISFDAPDAIAGKSRYDILPQWTYSIVFKIKTETPKGFKFKITSHESSDRQNVFYGKEFDHYLTVLSRFRTIWDNGNPDHYEDTSHYNNKHFSYRIKDSRYYSKKWDDAVIIRGVEHNFESVTTAFDANGSGTPPHISVRDDSSSAKYSTHSFSYLDQSGSTLDYSTNFNFLDKLTSSDLSIDYDSSSNNFETTNNRQLFVDLYDKQDDIIFDNTLQDIVDPLHFNPNVPKNFYTMLSAYEEEDRANVTEISNIKSVRQDFKYYRLEILVDHNNSIPQAGVEFSIDATDANDQSTYYPMDDYRIRIDNVSSGTASTSNDKISWQTSQVTYSTRKQTLHFNMGGGWHRERWFVEKLNFSNAWYDYNVLQWQLIGTNSQEAYNDSFTNGITNTHNDKWCSLSGGGSIDGSTVDRHRTVWELGYNIGI